MNVGGCSLSSAKINYVEMRNIYTVFAVNVTVLSDSLQMHLRGLLGDPHLTCRDVLAPLVTVSTYIISYQCVYVLIRS